MKLNFRFLNVDMREFYYNSVTSTDIALCNLRDVWNKVAALVQRSMAAIGNASKRKFCGSRKNDYAADTSEELDDTRHVGQVLH
jgi:hypothetical protein